MAQGDDITWRLRLDTTDAQQAAQQQMLQQQQQMQMQAMQMANMGMMGGGQISPMGAMSNQMYSSAVNNMGVTGMMEPSIAGFYGNPIMGPTQRGPSSMYQYPTGYLDSPIDTQYRPGVLHPAVTDAKTMIGRAIATSSIGQSSFGRFFGLDAMGSPGQGMSIDTPMYRSQQTYAETMGQEWTEFEEMLKKKSPLWGLYGASAAMSVGLIPGGLPIAAGLYGAGVAYEGVTDVFHESKEDYLEMGRYFRDASAPNIRQMLGGGASHNSVAGFIRGISKQAAKDKIFTREDYAQIEQMSFESGLMQTSNNTEKVLKVIENVSQGIKGLAAVGVKLKDMQKRVDELSAMGISLGENPAYATSFMAARSMDAFSAGTTLDNLMSKTFQASSMFAQQGFAMNIGAQIHSKNMALVGESIRAGNLSFSDIQYFGGREGMANSLTSVAEGLNRTPMGQISVMSMLRDPSMMNKIASGKAGMSDILKSGVMGVSPVEYLNMQYRMPQLTKDIDPATLQLGQAGVLINSLKSMLGLKEGDKLDPGILMQELSKIAGPEAARATMNILETAGKSQSGAMESAMDSAMRFQQENIRKAPGVTTNFSGWLANLKEKYIDGTAGYKAAHEFEEIGEIYDEKMKSMQGGVSSLRRGSVGVSATYDKLMHTLESRKAGIKENLAKTQVDEELKKRYTQEIEKGSISNEYIRNMVMDSDRARRATFDGVDKAIRGDYGSGHLATVTPGQVSKALDEIKKNANVSKENEGIIRAGLKQGILSKSDIELINGSKNQSLKSTYLNAAGNIEKSQDYFMYLKQGMDSTDGDTNSFGLRRVASMSVEARRDLVNSLDHVNQSVTQNSLTLAQAALGADKVKTEQDLKDLSQEDTNKIGSFIKNLQEYNTYGDNKKLQKYTKLVDNANEANPVKNVRLGLLKDLKKETDDSSKYFTRNLSFLTGVKGDFSTRKEVSFAASSVRKAGLDQILLSDSALEDAMKTGDLTALLGDENKAAADELLKNKDVAGLKKLISSVRGTLHTELSKEAEDNEELLTLQLQIEKGLPGGLAAAATTGTGSSVLQTTLNHAKKFKGDLAKEQEVSGQLSEEQGFFLANMLGTVKKDSVRERALKELSAMKSGEANADKFFSILGEDESFKDIAGVAQELIESKRNGGKINTSELTDKAITGLSRLNGGATISKESQELIKKSISALGSAGAQETDVTNIIGGLIGDIGLPSTTNIMNDRQAGLLTSAQASGIQDAVQASMQNAKLAAAIGDQLKMIPKSLTDSADALKAAFGTTKEPDSYSGAVDANTQAIKDLTSVIKSKGGLNPQERGNK